MNCELFFVLLYIEIFGIAEHPYYVSALFGVVEIIHCRRYIGYIHGSRVSEYHDLHDRRNEYHESHARVAQHLQKLFHDQ